MKASYNPSKTAKATKATTTAVGRYRDIGQKSGLIYGLKAFAIVEDSHGYESLKEVADIRLYCPGETVYCCAWIKGNGDYINGAGKAGGYGYHKPSAAIESALIDAGFSFDTHWGGSGESNTYEAVGAVCALVGYPNVRIIASHP